MQKLCNIFTVNNIKMIFFQMHGLLRTRQREVKHKTLSGYGSSDHGK